ncbi:MAG: bifunctional DNA-formamidopyrimidine glycosylase/DNA-(apurinic or apyrimidinic site) lyase [Desulfovibrionaceae bacterium]|nr:bifunctional DNA-formamidopyrimidine glycosylase/DNA-(apurinic or apyrimidinic site) lyase [Desulfovibrionaceae bacterium]
MPELPEVETVVRTLAPQVQGKRIATVNVLLSKSLQDKAELFPLLAGSSIDRVYRRAKLLLLSLTPAGKNPAGASLILAFHLKMTGSFFVHPAGTPPLKHTRIIFDLEDAGGPAGRLFFDDMRTFGFCRVMRPEDLNDWSFWAGLGPEPLEGTAEDLAGYFVAAFKNRRGAIKAALLDQSAVAGVGNIYADEALFRAGIRPDAKACSLDEARLRKLAADLRDILHLSIRECGSSIRDYRDANGKAGAFQNSFAVYGRKGQPCQHCGQTLQSARIAGRGTVFCGCCQR